MGKIKDILKKFHPRVILQYIIAHPADVVKRLLLVLLLLPFFFFHLQQVRPYASVRPLKGHFEPKVYSPASLQSWFSGDYQKTTDDYLTEEFGFRNFFVRLHNEIRFLMFKKACVYGVVVGKQDYLYEYGYILGYKGKEFMGDQALADSVTKIKQLQDTLASMGKHLLVVLAPSKVRVYPEFLPDSVGPEPAKSTNYNYYAQHLRQAGIHYIDFNALFLEKKKTSHYLLFPQLGVHWSRLEAVRAADTMMSYLAAVSGANLPRVKVKSIMEKDTLEDPDNDIVNSMNLLWYPRFRRMAYPEVEIDNSNKDMRNVIVIADSYWWDIYLRDIPKKAFRYNEFWYYNRELWGNNILGKGDYKTMDVKRHILQSDYIIIIATESNYSQLGFGFFGGALNALRRNIYPTAEELMDIKAVLRNDPEWLKQIEQKARQRHISVDSMLTLDAMWCFSRKGPVKKEITLQDVIQSIYKNSSWLKEIETKAADQHLPLDTVIKADARWYMETMLNIKPQKKHRTLGELKEQISHDYVWMEQIREKAKKRGISVDSMMTLDALYVMELEKNKN